MVGVPSVALCLVVLAALAFAGRLQKTVALLRRHPVTPVLIVALALMGCAVVVDQLAVTDGARFVEELLELASAGTLLVGARSIPLVEPDSVTV